MVRIISIVALLVVLQSCKQESSVSTSNDVAIEQKVNKLPLFIDSVFIAILAEEHQGQSFFLTELTDSYIKNGHKPLWNEHKKPKPHVELLFKAIDSAVVEGFIAPLDIEKFKVQFIDQDTLIANEVILRQDVLLSNLFLHLAQFKQNGIFPAGQTPNYWNINRTERQLSGILEKVLATASDKDPFNLLEIKNEQYAALRNYLFWLKQKEQEGGWQQVDSIGKIAVGDSSTAVPSLKKRLATIGEFTGSNSSFIYDSTLFNAVKKFQKLHGLNEDGVPGGKTLQALNVSVSNRIEQVKVNLERWKWLPEQFEEEHVLVNIPGFTAYAFRDQEKVLEMRVITGTSRTSTTVFNDTISYIVASPYWNIPFSISTGEILPQLKKNPGYIDTKHMDVLAAGKPIDHHSINWENVNRPTFPYQIRQKPGDFNSLGRIKFMFPNKYNIYMHDTNAKNLFNKDERALSHGCVRISKPVEFAQYLLHDKPEWTTDSLAKAMSLDKEQIIQISKKVPVYILYFTAWADAEGNVQLYKDIYRRDQELKTLKQEKISI